MSQDLARAEQDARDYAEHMTGLLGHTLAAPVNFCVGGQWFIKLNSSGYTDAQKKAFSLSYRRAWKAIIKSNTEGGAS